MEITVSECFNAVQKITQIAKKLEDSAMSIEVMVKIKDDLEELSEYSEVTVPTVARSYYHQVA